MVSQNNLYRRPCCCPRGSMWDLADQPGVSESSLAVNDPLVSPLHGSLNGLPPTYVCRARLIRSHNKRLSSGTAVVKERRSASYWPPGKSDRILLTPGVCCPGAD